MLFRKRIQRACSYCAHGVKLDDTSILCTRKGVMPMEGGCRQFRYDPCKRIPLKKKALDFSKYDKEDYTL